MNPTPQHVTAAALAALGATCAIPIPLAELDFAGVFNVFNIDSGDARRRFALSPESVGYSPSRYLHWRLSESRSS